MDDIVTDLSSAQINQHCKLSMPEGLKELMYDISREVLRAQPEDLYEFITKYLKALLVTREQLCIACQVCGDVCEKICQPTLVEELIDIGFNGEKAEEIAELIMQYFADENNNKEKLIPIIAKTFQIEEEQVDELHKVIKNLFLKRQLKNKPITGSSSDLLTDVATVAVHNTMKNYKKSTENEDEVAGKIQASFRGFIKRAKTKGERTSKGIRFDTKICTTFSKLPVEDLWRKDEECVQTKRDKKLTTVSSTTLAGSFLSSQSGDNETTENNNNAIAEIEKEHATIDYTEAETNDDKINIEEEIEIKSNNSLDNANKNSLGSVDADDGGYTADDDSNAEEVIADVSNVKNKAKNEAGNAEEIPEEISEDLILVTPKESVTSLV